MQIQTFSVLCGTLACNARCSYCVSQMTPEAGLGTKPLPINFRNFNKACVLAERCGATTMMLTGKGEPTLFPEQITNFLDFVDNKGFKFPLIELQTNGMTIADGTVSDDTLNNWYNAGLNTIAVSIVHYEKKFNHQNYAPYKKDYFEVSDLVNKLHGFGFSVRLNCVLNRSAIHKLDDVLKLIDFCKNNKVEQLTLVPVNKPKKTTKNLDVFDWVKENYIAQFEIESLKEYFDSAGNVVMNLNHGAIIYDYYGQNVCLSNCLTVDKTEEIRNLIFFPDGHLRYSWEYEGAILL
jgi:molybdenum cofactor biosynthesis enzyme MoaA